MVYAISLVLSLLIATILPAQTNQHNEREELAITVARMARIGHAYSPSFSPDGKQITFVSDLSGTPQLWIVGAGGGWPTLITSGEGIVKLSGNTPLG
jgi:WD40-like Beta Propeller Repeat